MAIDYQKTAKDLVKELGGDGNISNVTHCATRLRFILKDESIVDKEKVAKIKGVITTVQAGGQFQVVIGNHVTDAYKYVMELVTVDDSTSEAQETRKQEWLAESLTLFQQYLHRSYTHLQLVVFFRVFLEFWLRLML